MRIHQTLRATPAMAAGVTDRLWEAEDHAAANHATNIEERLAKLETQMQLLREGMLALYNHGAKPA